MSDTNTSTGLKATKGPWLRDDTALKGGIYCGDATGSLVARTRGAGFELVHRSDEELEANAQLIAAAPDMAHELDIARIALVECAHLLRPELPSFADSILKTHIDRIDAVLAKARGEQP